MSRTLKHFAIRIDPNTTATDDEKQANTQTTDDNTTQASSSSSSLDTYEISHGFIMELSRCTKNLLDLIDKNTTAFQQLLQQQTSSQAQATNEHKATS